MIELKNYLRTSFSRVLLFDTDLVADFVKGDKRCIAFFEDYVFAGLLTPTISSFTAGELFLGARDKREEQNLDLWLSNVFDVLDTNYEILREASILKKKYKMVMGDAIIPATATKEKIPLLTLNPDTYRKLDIKIFRPYV